MKSLISFINENRVGSTETADALGKTGVLEPDLISLNQNQFICGEVDYIYGINESNWSIHEQSQNVGNDRIVFVDNIDCGDKALFGELVAKYILLYRSCKGLIVNGRLRDIEHLKRYNFPIWYKGNNPIGCFNRKVEITNKQKETISNRKKQLQDSIAVCDETGVTFISADIDKDFVFNKLEDIELQEDIWSYCINVLKWSTYETICQKRYLHDQDEIPKTLLKGIKRISFDG